MSEEGDTFFVSLAERFLGLLLIIIGAILIYLTASTSGLVAFTVFFGVLSLLLLIIGVFLLFVKPSE
jgi:membrane-bound ClpP family serine protease